MKKKLFMLSASLMLLIAVSLIPSNSAGSPILPGLPGSIPAEQTTVTVRVTISAIDLGTNTITLKDQNGKIYVFTVDPTKIDLKKYKVGETFTATISTSVTTDKVTRARITKSQLIKLQ